MKTVLRSVPRFQSQLLPRRSYKPGRGQTFRPGFSPTLVITVRPSPSGLRPDPNRPAG